MNKIYRTVYNETTGTWVAVCETAKSHTKSSGSTVDNATASVSGSLKAYSLTAVTAAAALLSPLMANQAQADVLCKDTNGQLSAKAVCESNETQINTLSVGTDSAVNSDNSFAIGQQAVVGASSVDSVALGSNSKVGPNANNAFAAVGGQAKQSNSISIGVRSIADGEGAIAFGSGIPTGNISGSYAKGEGSIAIGKRAEAIGAEVTYSTSNKGEITLPQNVTEDQNGHQYSYSRTELTDGSYAAQMIAIGDNASAYGNQSIAIGGNAVAAGYASIAIGGDDIGNLKNSNLEVTDYLTGALKDDLTSNGFVVPSTITNLSNNKPWVNLTTTKGNVSTAFGIKAVAEGDLSNAYGVAARSAGKNSNAFGTVSYSGGDESIAFGTAAETGNNADYSVALGYMSQIQGKNSAAVGQKNKVGVENTFVLGNNVNGDLKNSVYLGSGSTTDTTSGGAKLSTVSNATLHGITYGTFAGQEAQGIVSVGSDTQARRIQNVAAGAIDPNSTDAINGSQLYAVLPKYFSDPDGTQVAKNGGTVHSVRIGDKLYQFGGDNVTVDGGATTVKGKGSVQVEPNKTAADEYTVSVPVIANSDNGNITPANLNKNSQKSIAIGDNAVAEDGAKETIIIGANTSTAGNTSNAVVIGANSKITASDTQNITVIGSNAQVTGDAPNAVVMGSYSSAANVAKSGIEKNGFNFRGDTSTGANAQGVNDKKTYDVATFNVGSDSNITRQIKGVAGGSVQKNSTDAVNGDQLYSVAVAVTNEGNSLAADGKGVLGKSFTIDQTGSYDTIGTIKGENVAGTGADNLEDAITLSRTKVQAGQGVKVSEQTTNGATTYTVNALTVSGDDGAGNATELTDANGKKYNIVGADGNDNTVTDLTVNNGQAAGQSDGNLKLTDKGENGNHKYDVSLNDQVDLTDAGSLKVGGDKQDSPVTNVTAGNIDFGDQQGSVTNVKGHLGEVDSTYNAGNDHSLTAPTASLGGEGGTLDTPLAVEQFRNSKNPALSEAATVGDVLNAGWELRANGTEVDFVTHADAINFKSSDNSISVAGEYDANNISNIDLKANVKLLKDGEEAENGDTANAIKVGDNTYNLGDGGDANWNLTVDGGNATTAGGKRNLKDSDTIDVAQTGNDILFNVKTTPLTVNNGVVGNPAAPNSLVTAGDVQTAINNAGWFVSSQGRSGSANPVLVNAGNEVKFIAGDGMDIVQNGKELTFNAKIVDSNGKQLTVDKDGNYVVSIVDPSGKPVTINSDGQYVVDGGGGSGNGNPFTITADDGTGNQSTTTIDGVDKTPGAGVAFVGDENTSVTKQETPNGTNVQVGLNDVVNVGGKPDANNPNKKPVTIDGKEGNITFNGDQPVTVSNQDGNLSVGDTKVVNMKPGENPTDGVNVSQLLDTVGAASSSPATDKDGNPIDVVKTTDKDGNEYTLKTYNVNGQGEYLTNNVVEAVSKMNEQGIKFFHVNDGTQTPVAQDTNTVDSQAFGKNAIAIGVQSQAKGENSIAIGTGNEVNGNNSGAIGDPSIIDGNNSYSVGNNNTVATDNTFVLGNNVTNTAANSVFLGDEAGQDAKGAGATGKVSNATVNDLTYSGFAGEESVGMVAVGNASQVRRVSGVAAGEISATSTDAINGSQLYSALSNSGVYVMGNGAAPTDANLVKLGDKANGLNFVNGNGTTARVEGNKVTFDVTPGYAEGIEAGENVEFGYKPVVDQNGNPLYVDGAGGTTTDPNAAQKDADGNPIQQQTTVINAKQPDLRPLEQQVQQVENNSYAGVAQAMATAGLPQAYLPGKSMVAVAGGYYKGESGYALGVSTISDSGSWVFKATASGNSRNNYGGTVGAGYQW